jgi:ribokinase
MAKIIGPGSLNVDITGYAPHLPTAGQTVTGSTLRLSTGGKGTNQMTAAHRAGAEAYIIGKQGDDVLGRILRDHYEKEGLSRAYVTTDPEIETGSALIEIDEGDAQNRIRVILAANARVGRDEVMAAEQDFADADAVLTQLETTIPAVEAAKELAQKYGKPCILNPAPCIPLPPALLDGIDYITPNETEAAEMTGCSVESVEDCRRAADVLLAQGVKNVVITLGSRGVFFKNADTECLLPALSMRAVETTGAGDAFNGGFATAIAEGMPIETALKFATCTAAISVTRLGTASSMPHRHEINELMEREFGIKL